MMKFHDKQFLRTNELQGLAIVLFLLLVSCSKDNDTQPEEPLPELPAVTVTASGEYLVENLAGDLTKTMEGQDGTGDGGFQTVYYSLEDGRAIPKEYANTDKWDIAFAGIYNSSIWANHGEVQFQDGTKGPGYGSPARGGLFLVVDHSVDEQYYDFDKHQPKQLPISFSYLDEAYDKVMGVTSDMESQLVSAGILSLDHFLGSGDGYAFYDFYGTMYPGNEKKTHVVYNLARPIIVKTAKGNWAKVIIYSFYKDKPVDPDRDNTAPYLTFKYAILKDGSKDFSTIEK